MAVELVVWEEIVAYVIKIVRGMAPMKDSLKTDAVRKQPERCTESDTVRHYQT